MITESDDQGRLRLTAVPAAAPARQVVPPAREGGRRSVPRATPERSAAFDHLTLAALRNYRRTLTAEEDQVSYWRRIIQARLDLIRTGALGPADDHHLRPVLAEERVASSRTALMTVVPVDQIPPLPNLSALWERRLDDGDTAGRAQLAADLATAEHQLSTYRQILHRQIAEATGELIARYREQPTLCLTALPLGRRRRAVPA